MDKAIIEKQIMQVYRATPEKIALVNKLEGLIKDSFPNVQTTSIGFKEGHLTLDDLSVRMVEIDPQKLGGVLVHWFPDFNVSTRQDPYCSAYMLPENEIGVIIREVTKIKEHYSSRN